MSNLFSEFCHIFCCPPRPSHIVAKFAFLPPNPTYTIVQEANEDNRRIVFKPEAGNLSEEVKSDLDVFYTVTKRGSRIACLYIPFDKHNIQRSFLQKTSAKQDRQSTKFTVIFSHGNAVDLGQMAEFLHSLSQCFQVNIFSYDYSGYGASNGQALEDNLYADAEAALRELRTRYMCPLDKIILYGQSIGTAPTVEVATKYKVAGVVLHSPLMSGIRLVCPGTTRSFCCDPFTNIDKVEKITSPTLIIHGTEDEVVGIHHGKVLYSRLRCPLEPLWVDGAGHNDIEHFPEYSQRLHKFFSEDLLSSSPESIIASNHDNGLGDSRHVNGLSTTGSSGSKMSSAPSDNESFYLYDTSSRMELKNVSSANLLQQSLSSREQMQGSLNDDAGIDRTSDELLTRNKSTSSLPPDAKNETSASLSQKDQKFISFQESPL